MTWRTSRMGLPPSSTWTEGGESSSQGQVVEDRDDRSSLRRRRVRRRVRRRTRSRATSSSGGDQRQDAPQRESHTSSETALEQHQTQQPTAPPSPSKSVSFSDEVTTHLIDAPRRSAEARPARRSRAGATDRRHRRQTCATCRVQLRSPVFSRGGGCGREYHFCGLRCYGDWVAPDA